MFPFCMAGAVNPPPANDNSLSYTIYHQKNVSSQRLLFRRDTFELSRNFAYISSKANQNFRPTWKKISYASRHCNWDCPGGRRGALVRFWLPWEVFVPIFWNCSKLCLQNISFSSFDVSGLQFGSSFLHYVLEVRFFCVVETGKEL